MKKIRKQSSTFPFFQCSARSLCTVLRFEKESVGEIGGIYTVMELLRLSAAGRVAAVTYVCVCGRSVDAFE